jgi:hypothetical protein
MDILKMKNLKRFLNFLLIASVLFIAPKVISTSAHACSCMMPPPTSEKFKNSELVFKGKVSSINTDKSTGIYGKEVKLQASKIWKGTPSKSITLYTSGDEASCGYYFQINKEYIIYSNKSGDILTTNSCSGNAADREMIKEETDLDKITTIKEIPPTTRISKNLIAIIIYYVFFSR